MRINPTSLERHRFLDRKVSPLYAGFLGACVSGLAAGLLWAAFFEIDVVIRALSVIRPFTNVSTLKNATPGTVGEKAYSNGQMVREGELLWKIDTTATEIDLRNSAAQLQRVNVDLEQGSFYAASLEAERNVVPEDFPQAFHKAEAYLANVRRLRLLGEVKRAKWEQESRLPPAMLLSQKVRELKEDWEIALLDLARTQAEERERVYSDQKTLLTHQETLRQRLAELQRLLRDSEVRAPISGVVEDVRKFNRHDFLGSAEEVARIVPLGSENLKLELKVDTRDIAEIRVGQTVSSVFPGLPPSRYGTVLARVGQVSADSVVVNGQLAYFLVEATLNQSGVEDKRGKRIFFKPGMAADSRIVVSKKTVLAFLLEKLEFIQ